MATKTATVDAPERSEAIDVTNPAIARGLAAAWQGLYHFVGARVNDWEILPPSDDLPDGGLIAHGFSVNAGIDPEQVITDIGDRNRRLEMFPTYFYIVENMAPADFDTPQDMTNFGVQYLKGSVEEGTAKTPEYLRKGVADYKATRGLRSRRGPKRRLIRLDGEIDPNQLRDVDPDMLAQFLEMAQKIVSANGGSVVTTETSDEEEKATASA